MAKALSKSPRSVGENSQFAFAELVNNEPPRPVFAK